MRRSTVLKKSCLWEGLSRRAEWLDGSCILGPGRLILGLLSLARDAGFSRWRSMLTRVDRRLEIVELRPRFLRHGREGRERKFADPEALPRPSGLGRGVSWCARALELSTEPRPLPLPTRPQASPFAQSSNNSLPRAGPCLASTGVPGGAKPSEQGFQGTTQGRTRDLATCTARLSGT